MRRPSIADHAMLASARQALTGVVAINIGLLATSASWIAWLVEVSRALAASARARTETPMIMSTLEWQLHQVAAGVEVVLVDAERHPVARGIVSRDRRTLYGPNGERILVESSGATGLRVVRRAAL